MDSFKILSCVWLLNCLFVTVTLLVNGGRSTTTQPPVLDCNPEVDIVFLFDGTVSEADFKKQSHFALELLKQHKAPADAVQVGMVICKENSSDTYKFQSFSPLFVKQLTSLPLHISEIPYDRNPHCIEHANSMFQKESRKTISKIAILTIGNGNRWVDTIVTDISDAMKAKGISLLVVAVGIKDFDYLHSLRNIASKDNTFFVLSSFEGLRILSSDLSTSSCLPISLNMVESPLPIMKEETTVRPTLKPKRVACRRVVEINHYEKFISFLGWIKSKCLPGNVIDLHTCKCVPNVTVIYTKTSTVPTSSEDLFQYSQPTTVSSSTTTIKVTSLPPDTRSASVTYASTLVKQGVRHFLFTGLGKSVVNPSTLMYEKQLTTSMPTIKLSTIQPSLSGSVRNTTVESSQIREWINQEYVNHHNRVKASNKNSRYPTDRTWDFTGFSHANGHATIIPLKHTEGLTTIIAKMSNKYNGSTLRTENITKSQQVFFISNAKNNTKNITFAPAVSSFENSSIPVNDQLVENSTTAPTLHNLSNSSDMINVQQKANLPNVSRSIKAGNDLNLQDVTNSSPLIYDPTIQNLPDTVSNLQTTNEDNTTSLDNVTYAPDLENSINANREIYLPAETNNTTVYTMSSTTKDDSDNSALNEDKSSNVISEYQTNLKTMPTEMMYKGNNIGFTRKPTDVAKNGHQNVTHSKRFGEEPFLTNTNKTDNLTRDNTLIAKLLLKKDNPAKTLKQTYP